jgi:hypothetical protein
VVEGARAATVRKSQRGFQAGNLFRGFCYLNANKNFNDFFDRRGG